LGAQLWLESDATSATVETLVARAAESGLDLLRVFLVWPWVEPEPGEWDFRIFDEAFAAAKHHRIGIKATLTANSGPWHIGTPSALHSHTLILDPSQRPAIERYVQACVQRYARHPALAQWVIWNEPFYPLPASDEETTRTVDERRAWIGLLERRYGGDIQALNERWRTGYTEFSEALFPEEIPHPRHKGIAWLSYGPWLDEYHHRAAWLCSQLTWIADLVRRHDAKTATCINPPSVFKNHAAAGYDFPSLASVVDVMGASFHPPWNFGFTPASRHAAVMASATSFLLRIPGAERVEVTETQLGNVHYASPNPRHVTAAEVARYFLAPLFAGAESVTGWSLNTRHHDFEAGDWGLLDDDDQPSDRSRMVARISRCLVELEASIGPWQPTPPRALVLCSGDSQAVQMLDIRASSPWEAVDVVGRREDDAAHGVFRLAAALLAAGIPTAPCVLEAISGPTPRPAGLIVVSHLVAYSEDDGRRLLDLVADGATLLVDGTSGHKTPDASLHRPWPGVLATELGFRSRGLITARDGFPVTVHGASVGRLVLALSDLEFTDAAWLPWSDARVGDQAAPLLWERSLGLGKVLIFAGALGPSLVVDPRLESLVHYIAAQATPHLVEEARPLNANAFVLRVAGTKGAALGLFGPDRSDRLGRPLSMKLAPGRYQDIWNGGALDVTSLGESVIDTPDGLAVLVAAAREP
jgi:hypothetical protein